jgi:hypothetical protein
MILKNVVFTKKSGTIKSLCKVLKMIKRNPSDPANLYVEGSLKKEVFQNQVDLVLVRI